MRPRQDNKNKTCEQYLTACIPLLLLGMEAWGYKRYPVCNRKSHHGQVRRKRQTILNQLQIKFAIW